MNNVYIFFGKKNIYISKTEHRTLPTLSECFLIDTMDIFLHFCMANKCVRQTSSPQKSWYIKRDMQNFNWWNNLSMMVVIWPTPCVLHLLIGPISCAICRTSANRKIEEDDIRYNGRRFLIVISSNEKTFPDCLLTLNDIHWWK